MNQAITNTSPRGGPAGSSALMLSLPSANALAGLPPEAALVTVRQMMETLFARVEALQQNQAIRFSDVHDRLDAVELELPMIQEQSALRMQDLEARVSREIEETSRSAVEEAAAALQPDVAGKFDALAAQMEAQRDELGHLRESKRLADTRLNRVILDIERLCGNLAAGAEGSPSWLPVEPVSPFRSRISEQIRKAAVDLAPGEENPLVGDAHLKSVRTPARAPAEPPGENGCKPALRTEVPPTAAPKAAPAPNPVSDFDTWKRLFMQDEEPLLPSDIPEPGQDSEIVICPRCYSDRTRRATPNRLDGIFRLLKLSPHRCRSCAHRFYRRGDVASTALDNEQPSPGTLDAMETR